MTTRWAGCAGLGAAAVVALLVAAVAAKPAWDRATMNVYRAGVPRHAEILGRMVNGNSTRERIEFDGPAGGRIPCVAWLPANARGRVPAVVFLYGLKMDMGDAEELGPAFTGEGFALFTPEQQFRGTRGPAERHRMREVFEYRRRALQTAAEMRALVDVIAARPDVDATRIYFWGASFGAMSGCRGVAEDRRLRAAVLTLAGGDLRTLVAKAPQAQKAPAWARALGPAAAWLLEGADPIRTVGAIAPRPVLFQNSENDDIFPRECIEALHRACGEPKEIAWYRLGHNHIGREAVATLVRDGVAWLKRVDADAGK
jgi:dipeptidyl aminopeptidase/acylaminoacyl peptidase